MTCFPSATHLCLALGADLPYADERCVGNLALTASGLFTRFNATHVSIRTSDTSSSLHKPPSQAKLERLFLEAEKAKVIEDWDAATKSYREVIELDPKNANAHFQLAQIYFNQNNLTEAQKEAETATKLDDTNKWYYETLATIYMQQGKAKEATTAFEYLLKKLPTNLS